MKKKQLILGLIAAFIIVVVFFVGIDYYIENKLKSTLKNGLTADFNIADFQLEVNSISGRVLVESLSIKKKNEPQTHVDITDFDLKGLSFYQLVFKNNIIIDKLEIDKLRLSVDENSELLQKDTTNSKQSQLKIKHFELKEFSIDSLNLELVSSTSKSAKLKIEDMSLDISDLKLNQDLENQLLPFWFEGFSLKQGKLTYLISEFNKIGLKEIAYQNNNIEIHDLSFNTIYDKAKFSKKIKTEKDHYSLLIPAIKLLNFKAEKYNDVKHIKSTKLIIDQPNLEVYRDKRVADDNSFKPLYSKKIRELPFQLTIDSAEIINAQIKYDEKTEKGKAPGEIYFDKLNANIANLSNTYKPNDKKTNLKLKGIFMEKTPLEAEWRFDVHNKRDEFTFKAALGSLKAEKFNNFTVNQMNVMLEGELDQTYLNIYGDNESSTTTMRLAYHDLKITLLNKKGNTKKILTVLTNFIIKKDNEGKSDKDIKAKARRDKQKSFFNFLWVSIKSALKEMI